MPEEIQSESKEETTSNKSTTANTPTPSASASLVKLLIIGAIAFVVWKYGIPLTKKATESLNSETTEEKVVEDSETTTTAEDVKVAKSNVRITPGFEKWEPEIRLQLEDWVGEGIAHELTHIGVNKLTGLMEIRYRTVIDGLTTSHKLYAKQDGIDGRYILIEGDKEFLVYPPDSE